MALHYAVRNKLLKEARLMIENGNEVNARDRDLRTPLMLCCGHEDEQFSAGIARMLLQAGAKVGKADKEGRNSLIFATIFGRLELLRLFLKAVDFSLAKKDVFGNSALHYASIKGNCKILSTLLNSFRRFDVDINSRNFIGHTPASLALQLSHFNCVEVFQTRTKFCDISAKIPNALLMRPWSGDLMYVRKPVLMLRSAIDDFKLGTSIHKSRPDLNIHQFRRGDRLDQVMSLIKLPILKQQPNKFSLAGRRKTLNSSLANEYRPPSNVWEKQKNCNFESWKDIVPELMEVLREQITPSYRPAAIALPQTYDDVFKPGDFSNANEAKDTEETFEKQISANSFENRQRTATLKAKFKQDLYDPYALQGPEVKRKGRRSSLHVPVQVPPIQRRKTVAKIM